MAYVGLILAALLAIFMWCYRRSKEAQQYWQNRGVAVPVPPMIFLGNLGKRLTMRCSFHEMQKELYDEMKEYRYAGYYEGARRLLMLIDEELVRTVLIKDFDYFCDRPTLDLRDDNYLRHMLISLKGTHWKKVRSVMTPTFSSGKIRAMTELLRHSAKQIVQFLDERDVTGKNEHSVDLKDLFGRYAMDIIANCAFGVQCDSLTNPNADFIQRASHIDEVSIPQRFLIFFVMICWPGLARYVPLNMFHHETLQFLAEVVIQTRKYRELDTKNRRNDFLQLLLDAASSGTEESAVLSDDRVLVAQALLFMIAGYETSSSALSSTAYELARHPEIQEKVRQETAELGHDSPYLEMVILEAMRLHPTVARLDRSVTAPYELDPSTGLILQPGDIVSINVIGMHFDERHFPEPNRYDPERFSPEEKAKRSPYVYLPFGAGPRNCIGARFAMLSIRLALSEILRVYEFKVGDKTEIPMKLSTRSLLHKAANGVWVDIVPLQKEDK
ncbi:cytochrome P450 6k1-like [Ctenocephalides felis]|uniref:cytochrome P450 6k1-like n=1 Tax=Ctenocephalides felis TaxID=7515 RepID=UPI000E6E311F|nr:cytochrome P450 6k1-like [Ctenocephalides felis]